MMFKNMTVMEVDGQLDLPTLNDILGAEALRPCTGLQATSSGFVPIRGGDMAYQFNADNAFFMFAREKKLLPTSVVMDALKEERDEYENQKGHGMPRKMVREAKERIVTRLLPQAFVQRSCTRVWLHKSWMIVDSRSVTLAEDIASVLRNRCREMGIHFRVQHMPDSGLFSHLRERVALWIINRSEPSGIEVGSTIRLVPLENRSTGHVMFKDISARDQVVELIQNGAVVDRAEITVGNLTTVLTADFRMTGIRYEEEDLEPKEQDPFEADCALMVGDFLPAFLSLHSIFAVD